MKSTPVQLFLVLFVITLGCKSKFNSSEWNENGVDWQWTNVREKMVDDLVDSDTLIGMDTTQVYQLLGKPEFTTDSSRLFMVREKYTTNIDPDYVKYLNVILLNGKVRRCEVYKTR
jgi:hypothetical protein